MRRILQLMLMIIFLSFLLQPSSTSYANTPSTWQPGFYSGWIKMQARIDTDAKWPGLDGFVIEKFFGRGQLMVKIDDQGLGGASLVLPVRIEILGYGLITNPQGSCTFSSSAIGLTNYVRLRHENLNMGQVFKTPLALAPGIRFSKTNASSFGELQGCEQAGAGNLKGMQMAMRATTAEMQEMVFTVKSMDDQSISGTCHIPGWEKITPIPNGSGQGVRSLPSCTWRVFRMTTPNQNAEWKK
jgi:hypothetical protein